MRDIANFILELVLFITDFFTGLLLVPVSVLQLIRYYVWRLHKLALITHKKQSRVLRD